jgi:hypothetical protein
MRRADRFIELHNQLSAHLIEITGERHSPPFYRLVDQAANRSDTVRREAARLREYGDLRNVIVHNRSYPEEIIAEPTEETLARFSDIVRRIIAPKRLDSYRKQIKVFSTEDKLVTALRHMHDNDFSQIVVRDYGPFPCLLLRASHVG